MKNYIVAFLMLLLLTVGIFFVWYGGQEKIYCGVIKYKVDATESKN